MKTKIFLITTGIISAIPFVLPFILFRVFNAGSLMGLLISAALCIYGFFFSAVNAAAKRAWNKKTSKILISFIALLLSLSLAFTIVTSVKMFNAANNIAPEETTVVVLGCMVYPDGPSLSLRQRIDAAYDLLSDNPNLKCILSGGQGADEPMSEAQAMYNSLVEKGIDKSRLYLEEKSTSTRENLRFSKELIEREGLIPNITIVTNDFHQYRAQKIARSLGVKCYGVSAESHIILFPCYYLRELGGILAEEMGII